MRASIVDVMGTHPVYGSLTKVLSMASRVSGLDYERFYPDRRDIKHIFLTGSKTISYSKLRPNKSNIYVLNSPIAFLEGWEFLIKGIPHIILEEYFKKNLVTDFFSSLTLRAHMHYPMIAQTKRTRLFLENLGISPFFIPPAEKKRKGSKKRQHILFVGRFVSTKNVLLPVMLARRMKDENFVLIGNGPMLKQVQTAVSSLSNVEIVNSVKGREELFDYYSKAKLLIHPAFKDPIGYVIIEALSTQTPVIASSGAGASDFLSREWVLDPKDEEAWVKKVRYVLQHQEESIKKAEETFEKEHLNIDDPYFEKVAEELAAYIKKRWPNLFKNR